MFAQPFDTSNFESTWGNQPSMGSSNHPADPKKAPVPWRGQGEAAINHHNREWASGSRGGGAVPKDFEWATSPKQDQEETGVGTRLDRLRRW
jgi:hypothetical protein